MHAPWRRLLSVGFVGILFAAATFCARVSSVSAADRQNAGASSAAADDLPLVDLDGYRDMVAQNHGKPLLVTFWATWCEPCRFEFPIIVDLAKQYSSHGLVVVGVNLDDDADMNLVRHFLTQNHPGFRSYRQKPGINVDVFYQGVNPVWRGTMPHNLFYARDGHIARFFIGEHNRAAFDQAIHLILASSGE